MCTSAIPLEPGHAVDVIGLPIHGALVDEVHRDRLGTIVAATILLPLSSREPDDTAKRTDSMIVTASQLTPAALGSEAA